MNYFQSEVLLPAAMVGVAIAVTVYYLLNAPDNRSAGDKIEDAVSEMHNGPKAAAHQLEDRTPGEKLQDAISDARENIEKALNQE